MTATAVVFTPAQSAEQIVTLGDSLTFAYEAEFNFNKTVNGSTFGDGFSPEVKNWIEILSAPNGRDAWFELGTRDSINVYSLFNPYFTNVPFYFRQSYNWAVPGMKIDQLRRFIDGEEIRTILAEDPDFATLATLLDASDYEDSDFAVVDLENQIANTAERLTLFIGGNDARAIYGTIYNGGNATSFINEFMDDATYILNWVNNLNPNIQVVVVNIPHVGITPDVQSTHPTDPLLTPNATAALTELNSQLRTLATSYGYGYADIFSPTLPLLDPNPLCIHGIQFLNSGSTTGDLDYVWLNGELSANFHPNTNAQAVIANIIIDSFNETYCTDIPPLTATEMLGGLLAKTPAEIDMPFANWMDGFGLTGLGEGNDDDRDGIPAGVEFGLGLDPTWKDASKISSVLVNGDTELELAYPMRLDSSTNYMLLPESGTNLMDFTPFISPPAVGPDGLARARISLGAGTGFLRLNCEITP